MVNNDVASDMNVMKILLPSKMSNGFDFKPNSSVTILENKNASINILESFQNTIFESYQIMCP